MTWLPEARLRSIGVEMFKRDQVFVMANGQEITRDVGIAVIGSGEFKTVDEVVFARSGDRSFLGGRTLEGFNASVDSRRKRLVAVGPILAARSRRGAESMRSPGRGVGADAGISGDTLSGRPKVPLVTPAAGDTHEGR